MSERLKLYVGCGLTDAPEEFKDTVEELKDWLREDWEVMEFLGLEKGTAGDVYRTDIGNVIACDAFLGVCDYPSTGLGAELQKAWDIRKPALGVAHNGSRVSRMVIGAEEEHPSFSFRRYENMLEDVPSLVIEEFQVVRNALARPQP